MYPGADVPNKLPATIHGSGGGKSNQDGLCQPGDGVCPELPAVYVAGPARHTRERAQGDDVPEDSDHQP